MHNLRRRLLQGAAAAGALSGTLGPVVSAFAQERYPAKPVKIIVPLPPGGVVDNSVRLLLPVMQPSLGQSLLVENKPGGTFQIAMSAITQAPADGYTLMHINAALLSTQALFKRFDVFKQLVPVAGIGASDITISVSGKTPYKTMRELIEFGRSNPNKLSYASPGIGTLEHLALWNFCKKMGIEATHVPVKGGPEVAKMLVQGEVQFGTLAVPFIHQFGPSGGLRALLVLNSRRNPTLPSVPSLKDEKLDLDRLVIWGGIAALAGTPKSVIDYLEKQFQQAINHPDIRKQYSAMGLEPDFETAAEFGQSWRDDWGWIAKAVAESKPELN